MLLYNLMTKQILHNKKKRYLTVWCNSTLGEKNIKFNIYILYT